MIPIIIVIYIIDLQITIQEELRVDGGREDQVDDFNPKAEGECQLEAVSELDPIHNFVKLWKILGKFQQTFLIRI